MKNFMLEAIKQADKAYKINEVPVGCVIVRNNEIIARAYNQKEKKQDITRHAEVIAIEKASRKLGNWHLDDCILYTTLRPCLMCSVIITQSRIKKIIYALDNVENIDYFKEILLIEPLAKHVIVEKGIYDKESLELLQKFFQNRRKNDKI